MLDHFKSRVRILTGMDADMLRAGYITRFVDADTEYFRRYIGEAALAGGRSEYSGYLWDTFKRSETITEAELLREVALRGDVYVFWDLHSAKRILISDYWRFPKEAVLATQGQELADVIVHDSRTDSSASVLPEDLYIFDSGMESSLAVTHEYVPDRYCLRAT